jgi:hypothetical protein
VGTGEWLLHSQKYEAWLKGSHAVLWFNGGAGCGKTIVFSMVVDDIVAALKENPDWCMAYFYLTFRDVEKQTYRKLLLSWVTQLFRDCALDNQLREAYRTRAYLSDECLENVIVRLASQPARILLLVDGLDEVPTQAGDRKEVLKGLQRICDRARNITMFLTSRAEFDIRTYIDA